jgi:hypothetical protein
VNDSLVEYSTNIRAGRSVRLHTRPRPAVTSPDATPYGTCGRVDGDVTIAGACPKIRRAGTRAPTPAAPATRRKSRLFMLDLPAGLDFR